MATGCEPLFVSNISYNTNRKALCNFFSQFSNGIQPKVCKLLIRNGRFSGCVKLVMPNKQSLEDLKLKADSGKLYHLGRSLNIQAWRDPPSKDHKETQEYQCTEDWCDEVKKEIDNKTLVTANESVEAVSTDTVSELVNDERTECSGEDESLISTLPDDVIFLVFDYLSLSDLVRLERVSHRFRDLVLRKWCSIKTLKISIFGFSYLKPISDKCFENLLRKTNENTLTKLDMSTGCQWLHNRSMGLIGQLCPNLTEINLTTNTVNNMGLQNLANGCRSLRVITLNDGGGKIGEQGLWYLFNYCKDLEIINMDSNRRIKGPCLHKLGDKVHSMSLTNCTSLTDVGIEKISKFCPVITRLEVSRCSKLTDIGLGSLGMMKTLSYLDLSGDFPMISSEGLKLLSNLVNLVTLILARNDRVNDYVLRDISRGCRKLKTVNVSQMPCAFFETNFSSSRNVTDVSVVELARNCRDLCSLNVSFCCGVSNEAIFSLARYSCNLTLLRLRCCNVDTSSVSELILLCSMLEFLDLVGCLKVGNAVLDTAKQCMTVDTNRRLEIEVGGTAVDEAYDVTDIPLNLTVRFDCPPGLRTNGEDEDYNGQFLFDAIPAGAEDEYYADYADFLDADDPLYEERFEMS